MRGDRLHGERGMDGDARHVTQLRLPAGLLFHQLVVRARLHAMRRRQHQVRRDQGAAAEVAARTDNGDDGAPDAFG